MSGEPPPSTTSTTSPDSTASTGSPAEPTQKIRVSLFVYLMLAAILLYVGSAGPAAYLAVAAHRHVNQTEWIETTFYTIYRPHLDLCYRRQGYYEYIRWFIVKAGGNSETHAQFKEFWEVEAGYRKPPPP